MIDYSKMYYHLFNKITDALAELENQNNETAKEILYAAHLEVEELYLSAAELEEGE